MLFKEALATQLKISSVLRATVCCSRVHEEMWHATPASKKAVAEWPLWHPADVKATQAHSQIYHAAKARGAGFGLELKHLKLECKAHWRMAVSVFA